MSASKPGSRSKRTRPETELSDQMRAFPDLPEIAGQINRTSPIKMQAIPSPQWTKIARMIPMTIRSSANGMLDKYPRPGAANSR